MVLVQFEDIHVDARRKSPTANEKIIEDPEADHEFPLIMVNFDAGSRLKPQFFPSMEHEARGDHGRIDVAGGVIDQADQAPPLVETVFLVHAHGEGVVAFIVGGVAGKNRHVMLVKPFMTVVLRSPCTLNRDQNRRDDQKAQQQKLHVDYPFFSAPTLWVKGISHPKERSNRAPGSV